MRILALLSLLNHLTFNKAPGISRLASVFYEEIRFEEFRIKSQMENRPGLGTVFYSSPYSSVSC